MSGHHLREWCPPTVEGGSAIEIHSHGDKVRPTSGLKFLSSPWRPPAEAAETCRYSGTTCQCGNDPPIEGNHLPGRDMAGKMAQGLSHH